MLFWVNLDQIKQIKLELLNKLNETETKSKCPSHLKAYTNNVYTSIDVFTNKYVKVKF